MDKTRRTTKGGETNGKESTWEGKYTGVKTHGRDKTRDKTDKGASQKDKGSLRAQCLHV